MGIVWTLRAKGLAPSLGAGGSLLVAIGCCLVLATGVLTFRDWPAGSGAVPAGTIALPAPPAKASGRVASGPPGVAVASPARHAAERTALAPRGRSRRPVAAPPAATNPPASRAPAPGAAAPPASATRPGAAAPQAPAPAPTRPQPEPAETIVDRVREPLPPVIRQPVQPVLDTVQAVGRTVDETAGPLLSKLP